MACYLIFSIALALGAPTQPMHYPDACGTTHSSACIATCSSREDPNRQSLNHAMRMVSGASVPVCLDVGTHPPGPLTNARLPLHSGDTCVHPPYHPAFDSWPKAFAKHLAVFTGNTSFNKESSFGMEDSPLNEATDSVVTEGGVCHLIPNFLKASSSSPCAMEHFTDTSMMRAVCPACDMLSSSSTVENAIENVEHGVGGVCHDTNEFLTGGRSDDRMLPSMPPRAAQTLWQ